MQEGEERQHEMSRRFGENVRRHRERKNMSQADLAREMSARGWPWHQSTVYKIEHGDRRTDAFEVHDLAAILGIGIDRMFWAGAEANETALVDSAIAGLRSQWREAAGAMAGLHAAIASADAALRQHRDSKYERVRLTCGELETEMTRATVDSALEEAEAIWQDLREGR